MLTPDYEDIARQLAGVVFDLLTSNDTDAEDNRPPFSEVFPNAAALIPRTRVTGRSDGAPFGPVKTIAVATPEGVYAIPGPPPTERTVTDAHGCTWKRVTAGHFVMVMGGYDTDPEDIGREMNWPELIALAGPITLLPLTEEEEAQALLYGPPGQRWGDPYKKCPYEQQGAHLSDNTWEPPTTCALGLRHSGPHRDKIGSPLGETEADGTMVDDNAAALAESMATPCTCGHPGDHQPGCARYARVSGAGQIDEERGF